MIEVRVSEETPNLSHPSNLNSTVRLENSSPSLMRLIKASGRTHSWEKQRSERNLGERPRGSWWDAKSKRKMMQQQSCWESKSSWWDAKNKEVEAFLLREQEELKHSCWENKREQERGRAEKRDSICRRRECIPKQREVWISDSKEEQAVPYGFVEVIQHVMCTEIEKKQQLQFLGVLACIPRLSNNICWHKNWGNCCNIFLSVFPYSPYSLSRVLAQISWQSVQH